MKQQIKELIAKSGKHTTVAFHGKDKRVSFDENFGKEKIDLIDRVLGNDTNRKLVLNKLSK